MAKKEIQVITDLQQEIPLDTLFRLGSETRLMIPPSLRDCVFKAVEENQGYCRHNGTDCVFCTACANCGTGTLMHCGSRHRTDSKRVCFIQVPDPNKPKEPVTITIKGPVGASKTVLGVCIQRALKAAGIKVAINSTGDPDMIADIKWVQRRKKSLKAMLKNHKHRVVIDIQHTKVQV